MRHFYRDEGPIETLLQITRQPIRDGELIDKAARTDFVQLGWVAQCHGWNVVTLEGEKVVKALKLRLPEMSA